VLAGFSMGTGEVTRYFGTYGSAGVSKAALFGVIPPFLLQTDDNPKGVPGDVFDGIKATVLADRYAWFDGFFADFYNTDVLAPERIGDAVHGTADRILPFEATAVRLRDEQRIADLTIVEIADGPHNIGWTHHEELNEALLAFLAG